MFDCQAAIAALPTRVDFDFGIATLRADLRSLRPCAPRHRTRPRPYRVSAGPRIRRVAG